jgi:uncharacterized membrane protein YbhN (UPF0104 family)
MWAWARAAGGLMVLVLLVWEVGTGPFLSGVRAIHGSALVAAFSIGVATTVSCAWRWSLVAGGLGVRLPLRRAIGSYYRSQFLNTTLPGGVVGDVHRAVRHGVDIGDVGLGVRAVVLERIAGQTIQVLFAVIVLSMFPSPLRRYMPGVALALVVGCLCVVLAARTLTPARMRDALTQVRRAFAVRRVWLGVVVSSTVVAAGYLATFVLAARSAGSTAPLYRLVPMTMLALMAMILPLNIAGWGPREGVAAWAFGAAGLTASQGVSTAVTYGLLVFVGSLPGAAVLALRWFKRERARSLVAALGPGGVHG